MRAANCDRDGGLKCLRASSVFGGAARQKDTPEGCLTDLWRLISFRLILRKRRAGETWTCIGNEGITTLSLIYNGSKKGKRKGRGQVERCKSEQDTDSEGAEERQRKQKKECDD